MKTLSLHCVAALSLVLVTGSMTATFAQTTPTSTTTAPATTPSGRTPILTEAEKAELKKDHDQVLAADPTLKAEAESLKAAHKAAKSDGGKPTPEEHKAMKDHEAKVRAAILKIDPAASAIFAKLDAAPHHHHHD